MRLDGGRVFGASERLQPVIEAPASVSFIAAEEIARYGYRTLADILRGVRGMYVVDDCNYSLIGTRGFALPGDYNSRMLLLINGHRVNDNIFGQAEVGAEFGLDMAIVERVEGQCLSSRSTLAGAEVSGATTVTVSMLQPLGSAWELFGSVRNIFDAEYADPVSSQHRQDAIPQNGRTARIGLRWRIY